MDIQEPQPILAVQRPLAASNPLFEAGNMDRELMARECTPQVHACLGADDGT